jgi:hypothetical protein
VCARRTGIEKQGGERKGSLSLSLSLVMFGFWSRGDGWDGWSYHPVLRPRKVLSDALSAASAK